MFRRTAAVTVATVTAAVLCSACFSTMIPDSANPAPGNATSSPASSWPDAPTPPPAGTSFPVPGTDGGANPLVRPDDGSPVGFTPTDVQTVRPGQPVSGVGADIAIDSVTLRRNVTGTVAVIRTKVRNTRGELAGEECGMKPIVVIQDARGYPSAPLVGIGDIPDLEPDPDADPVTQLEDIAARLKGLTCAAEWRVGTTTEYVWEIPIESGAEPVVFGFCSPATVGPTLNPEFTWISLRPFLN
ncbi:hypothetical protein [Corynebacterium antarcticum]|uniref:hypothetical protein n=1 Tax=Corynebacterium antarcticum TaxID=2800405 RepID=UPI0020040B78|nr:hypothetical protein [Corynebacterium antarcticum]MCK7660479.1 hypothetical protein [Corynebacterium antarcticum]MCX7491020.1 hypothetical protein [Corynebacterium antarcticum]MCX7539793.1 hypothetical protein [Corynebacterium antarcticum]